MTEDRRKPWELSREEWEKRYPNIDKLTDEDLAEMRAVEEEAQQRDKLRENQNLAVSVVCGLMGWTPEKAIEVLQSVSFNTDHIKEWKRRKREGR